MKPVTFIVQVLLSLAFILGVVGYTAVIGHAMVTPKTVLQVIQK